MEKVRSSKRRLRLPSPAMTVACLALAIALSGASYAAVALPRNSVGTAQLKRNAVISAKVRNDALTGNDINEARLGQVPSASRAITADTAENAGLLDSLDSTAFLRAGAVRIASTAYLTGPLPQITEPFTVQGNRLLVSVSGSAFRTVAGDGTACLQATLLRDGPAIPGGSAFWCHYFNEPNEHETFLTRTIAVDVPSSGTYRVRLDAGMLTNTNSDDRYQVVVLEIP